MTPKDAVREWIKLFNAADIEGLVQLYTPEAVNHQVVMDPLRGREAIKQMFIIEFGRPRMQCIEVNLFRRWRMAYPGMA